MIGKSDLISFSVVKQIINILHLYQKASILQLYLQIRVDMTVYLSLSIIPRESYHMSSRALDIKLGLDISQNVEGGCVA